MRANELGGMSSLNTSFVAAGDRGFDPLRLAANPSTLPWLVEGELYNGCAPDKNMRSIEKLQSHVLCSALPYLINAGSRSRMVLHASDSSFMDM